ncbi:DUF5719 family protein [Nocardioides zeae]|uniref:DUF5719 family protein n=1 Tax=Nocardioides imazamoxiresistens TaxID=3231893 RepID=A0ABU3Q079_9ACTN|nr:DUF5719 family protein [Nocardioides zeae]MDT9594928.1 DUF5719 family protein [Nocardioides zeae]
MSEQQTPSTGGGRRRAAEQSTRRRVDATLVAAVVLPLLVVLAGAAVRVGAPPPRATAPDAEPRREAVAVCPSTGVAPGADDPDEAVPGEGTVRVATTPEAAGEVTAYVGTEQLVAAEGTAAPVADGAVADTTTGDVTVLEATGEPAGGLVAARFDDEGGAGTTCAAPTTGAWFVGLGAGADRSSVVELTNPDSSTAVATLTLHDESGQVDAEGIRSVVLEAGTTRRLDLGQLTPSSDELALHVDVTRGRLGVGTLTTTEPLDGGEGTGYWAASAAAPTTGTTLLGLGGEDDAARTLVVANPDETTAQVRVELLGDAGLFTPTDLDELTVEPGAVATLDLTGVVQAARADGAQGAAGVRVTASVPVVAGLRSGSGADESAAVVAEPAPRDVADGTLSALLPPAGASRLVLTNAGGEAAPEVVVRDADGAELARVEAPLATEASTTIALADGAARVDVLGSADDDLRGAVLTGPGGTSVLALTAATPSDLVPTVRRAWP